MSFNLKEKIHPKSSLNHPHYPELVNNFVLYNKMMDPSSAQLWDNQPPTYGNYTSILEIYQDIIGNPSDYIFDGSITVTVPVSRLWTCDANLHYSEHADDIPGMSAVMGYDRLNKYDEIMNKAPKFMKKIRFSTPD